jgi:hypothetical protein
MISHLFSSSADTANADLADNALNGTLPFEISHLTDVVRLDLSNKDLFGPITNIFSRMVKLTEITFENNKFSGPIPDTFADENPLLNTLTLAGNEFNSTLPLSLTQLPLRVLQLAGNKITGPIPSEIGNLVEMSKCGSSESGINVQASQLTQSCAFRYCRDVGS